MRKSQQTAFLKEYNDLCLKHGIMHESVLVTNSKKIEAGWALVEFEIKDDKINVTSTETIDDSEVLDISDKKE